MTTYNVDIKTLIQTLLLIYSEGYNYVNVESVDDKNLKLTSGTDVTSQTKLDITTNLDDLV